MTTDITELAQMKGQKVEAPYYLAECTECGKMYPSSQLIESRNYMDGDADCYCPHCNATDPDIADCGSEGVTAWNYQQARIDALVEALEKALEMIAFQQGEIKALLSSLESRTVTAENLQESAFRAGLTAGWNLGLANNNDGFNKCLAAHAAGIKVEAE